MNQEVVTEYYAAVVMDTITQFAKTWMELEKVMLSEVSQKEKYRHMNISLIGKSYRYSEE